MADVTIEVVDDFDPSHADAVAQRLLPVVRCLARRSPKRIRNVALEVLAGDREVSYRYTAWTRPRYARIEGEGKLQDRSGNGLRDLLARDWGSGAGCEAALAFRIDTVRPSKPAEPGPTAHVHVPFSADDISARRDRLAALLAELPVPSNYRWRP